MTARMWQSMLFGGLLACADASGPAAAPATEAEARPAPVADVKSGESAPDAGKRAPEETPTETQALPLDTAKSVSLKLGASKLVPPAKSCVVQSESEVYKGAGGALLNTQRAGELALMIMHEKGFALQRLRGGSLVHAASLALKVAPKRSAFVQSAERGFLAWVDAEAKLWVASLDGDKFGAASSVADGVDRRFAPALFAQGKQVLVAFTRSFGPGMHVYVSRVGGDKGAVQDVTPDGHGGSAPTFIAGRRTPALVMLDARAGVSPLLEVRFDAGLRPQPAIVRTPVSQPYAPPGLVALAVAPDLTMVAFTAIGRAAATAVGLVPLERAEQASALVPSKGYGELELSGAVHEDGLSVFAVEAFRTTGAKGPRLVQVNVVDGTGAGSALEVGAEGESASAPSLVALREKGQFALAYSTPQGVQLASLECSK